MTTPGAKSRRDRTVIAAVVVVALYAFAALMWFTGRGDAWKNARNNYYRECRKYESEKALIGKRAYWTEVAESKRVQMPMVDELENSTTRWRRIIGGLAEKYHVDVGSGLEAVGAEEEHGEVWEQAVRVTYDASLQRLVEFLYAVNTADQAMLDVREISISARRKNVGALSGVMVLTCAYLKGNVPKEGETK